MSAIHPPLARPSDASQPSARPALVAGLVVLLLAFWPTWPSYVSTWLEMREHAFLVAGFALWLAWRSRDRQLVPGEPHGVVAVPIALLSLVWLAGIVLNAQLVQQAAVPVLVLGWVLAVAGWRAALAAIPVIGTFFLVVPFWGAFTPPLQAMTVAANAVILGATGIQAKIEGNYIAIPSGVFEVAGACAGVKYFESGITIAIVYGLLFLRTWRARAVAVFVAALLSVVSNWIRVVGLIIVGHVTEMQSSLINDHNTYGWIIFAATLSLFFLLARKIEAYDDRLHQGAAAAEPVEATTSNIARRPWRRLLAPTAAALIGPVVFVLAGAGRAVAASPDAAIRGIAPSAGWRLISTETVPPQDTARWAPVFVGVDEHRRLAYRFGDSVDVRVDRLIYLRQAQGKELINALNEIAEDSLLVGGGLVGPLDDRGRRVNATVVREAGGGRLVWSWYVVSGETTHSSIEGKLLELGGFLSGDHAAELIAVSTRCGPTDCNTANAILFNFVTGRRAPPTGTASKP